MTLANLRTRVKTQLRAELASGSLAVSDLHDDSISQWANEEIVNVILILKDPRHFKSLNVIGASLTFATGEAALPADFLWPHTSAAQQQISDLVSVTIISGGGTVNTKARIVTPNDFRSFDSSNFVLTPATTYPIVTIADKIYTKPVVSASALIDYISTHQDIASGTEFDAVGDNVLVQLILARYYEYRELPDLQALALERANGYK